MKVFEIVFSPTGGTAKVSHVLAKAFEGSVKKVDLTERDAKFGKISVEKDDICVIAVPSYGGRVPAAAAERIAKISGNGAKTVLAAVYGNREFEDTLTELYDVASEAGFVPAAAVSAVAEHSIARTIAENRPDRDDIKQLEAFAKEIAAKFAAEAEIDSSALQIPGNRPYKEYSGSVIKQVTDSCVKCGACEALCPVGAIPVEDPSQMDENICISCMKCIAVCPLNARSIDPDVLEGVTKKLSAICSERKENKLYI